MSIRCAKMLVTGLMLFLLTSPAQSQVLSLWGDEGMTTCEVHTSPYQAFNVFVFLEPSVEGAFVVAYKLAILPGHFSTGQVLNPVVADATNGVWFGAPGIEALFSSCQIDIFWVVNLTMMAPNTTPGYYEIEPYDDLEFPIVLHCPGGRYEDMKEDVSVYNHFGVNASCVIGTEESSWGAIKSLYR